MPFSNRASLSLVGLALSCLSAQAADLPMMKAEPVEYVKVCSEFGAGFYYIPGSDTCLSINGYVRADYWYFEPETRSRDGFRFYTRGRVNFDARTATEYGTLRSFLSLQYDHGDPGTDYVMKADKAFIQFGGWTAGYATSFYNFYDAEAGNTLHGTYFSSSATTHLLAYTAAFGNGLAATLSIEDNYYRRRGLDFDPDTIGYAGQRAPDVVASLRWTQDWGKAQIMAAAHQTRTDANFGNFPVDNESIWGWAIGAGVIIQPSGSNWFFALEGNYARGASSYVGLSNGLTFERDVNDLVYINIPLFDWKRVTAWSVTGDVGYTISPSVVLHAVVSYGHNDNPGPLVYQAFDFDAWGVALNGTWTIVKGLSVALEGSYESRDYDENDNIFTVGMNYDYHVLAGGLRLKRSF